MSESKIHLFSSVKRKFTEILQNCALFTELISIPKKVQKENILYIWLCTLWKGIKMYVRDNKNSHCLLSWSPLSAVEQKYITEECSTENTLQKKKIYITQLQVTIINYFLSSFLQCILKELYQLSIAQRRILAENCYCVILMVFS